MPRKVLTSVSALLMEIWGLLKGAKQDYSRFPLPVREAEGCRWLFAPQNKDPGSWGAQSLRKRSLWSQTGGRWKAMKTLLANILFPRGRFPGQSSWIMQVAAEHHGVCISGMPWCSRYQPCCWLCAAPLKAVMLGPLAVPPASKDHCFRETRSAAFILCTFSPLPAQLKACQEICHHQ